VDQAASLQMLMVEDDLRRYAGGRYTAYIIIKPLELLFNEDLPDIN
jgi:hypothetical protein